MPGVVRCSRRQQEGHEQLDEWSKFDAFVAEFAASKGQPSKKQNTGAVVTISLCPSMNESRLRKRERERAQQVPIFKHDL